MRLCIFACILGVASGLAINNIANVNNSGLPIGPFEFAFMSHHKTGTAVLRLMSYDFSLKTGIGEMDTLWKAVDSEQTALSGGVENGSPSPQEVEVTKVLHNHLSHDCSQSKVLFFEDMRPLVLGKFIQRCKGFRAVHLVRRPSTVVVSNYVYTRNLLPGEERIQDIARGAILKAHNMAWGVKFECEKFYQTYAPQMLMVHQQIKDLHSPNILEVRYEDLMANYDNTTRSIFAHLLGPTNPLINNLVVSAAKYDKNRMPKTDKEANRHISSNKDKADAKKEMIKMEQAGDPCAAQLKQSDLFMGYTDPWL